MSGIVTLRPGQGSWGLGGPAAPGFGEEGRRSGPEPPEGLPPEPSGSGGSCPGESAWPQGTARSVDVLLVEDDRDHREIMAEILLLEGFTVESAPEGGEALRLLQEGLRPGVILLDLMMRGVDGLEFRRRQQESPEWASIPVVVLSGDSAAHDNASLLGVAAVLMKPAEMGRVLETLRRYIR